MALLRLFAKIFLWGLAALALTLALAFAWLWTRSPGTPQPVESAAGAAPDATISVIEPITLGGVEQHLIIRGADATAPVLLFVHGGPGSPEYALLRQTNLGLEQDFVVVYWEQRGAGMSYDAANLPKDMSVQRFVDDAAELSVALAERFGKEKIYLMGHSWGSVVGLLAARQYPELFHHYFGIGQVADQHRGEKIGLDWVRARAEEDGNADAIAALADLEVPAVGSDRDTWFGYIVPQRLWLDRLGGGLTHAPKHPLTPTLWLAVTREYTLGDKLDYLRGALFSVTEIWNEMVALDLINDLGPVEVPVTILHGAHDFQTPRPLAEELFERLDAEDKRLVIFDASAHSPIMEEPDRFNAVVRERAGLGG